MGFTSTYPAVWHYPVLLYTPFQIIVSMTSSWFYILWVSWAKPGNVFVIVGMGFGHPWQSAYFWAAAMLIYTIWFLFLYVYHPGVWVGVYCCLTAGFQVVAFPEVLVWVLIMPLVASICLVSDWQRQVMWVSTVLCGKGLLLSHVTISKDLFIYYLFMAFWDRVFLCKCPGYPGLIL